MRCLSPLVAGANRWVLPMADRSADALAARLLGETSEADDSLVDVLSGDPPLLLWAVCVADRRGEYGRRLLGVPILGHFGTRQNTQNDEVTVRQGPPQVVDHGDHTLPGVGRGTAPLTLLVQVVRAVGAP